MKEDELDYFEREIRRKLYDATLPAPGYISGDLFKRLDQTMPERKPVKEIRKWMIYVTAMAAVWTTVAVVFFHPSPIAQQANPSVASIQEQTSGNPTAFVSAAGWLAQRKSAEPKVQPTLAFHNANAKGSEVNEIMPQEDSKGATAALTLTNNGFSLISSSQWIQEKESGEQASFRLRIVENKSPDNNVYEEIITGKYDLPVVFLEKEKVRLLENFPVRRTVRVNP